MRSKEADKAAEYLRQVARADSRVKQCAEILEEQRQLIYSLKSPLYESEVKGCSDPDKFGAALAKLEQFENDLNESIDIMVDLKIEAYRFIEALPVIKYRELLTARYIQGKTVNVIAEKLIEDYRNVYRQINRALELFYEINLKADT